MKSSQRPNFTIIAHTWPPSKIDNKLLQEGAPRCPRNLAVPERQKKWSRSSSAFRQSIQQKRPTSKVLFLTSLFTVLTCPSNTCQIKNLTFMGTFALQTTSKTDSEYENGSNKWLNRDLFVKPLLGLGFQTRTSFLPSLKIHPSGNEFSLPLL